MSKRKNELLEDLEVVDEVSMELSVIADKIGLKTNAGREFLRVVVANARLMDRKQQDYGPGNIAGFGSFGVTVRMNDKLERLKTLFGKKGRKTTVVNESITDTYRDISNYGSIALLLELGRWPKE